MFSALMCRVFGHIWMSDLLCPWCQSTQIDAHIETIQPGYDIAYAMCFACGARGPIVRSKWIGGPDARRAEALRLWNTRRSTTRP
jgi:hypothetical protein